MSKQQVLPVGQDDKVFGVLEMFGFFPTHGPKAAREWATLGFGACIGKQQVLPVGQDDKVVVWPEMFGWPVHDGFIVMGGKEGSPRAKGCP